MTDGFVRKWAGRFQRRWHMAQVRAEVLLQPRWRLPEVPLGELTGGTGGHEEPGILDDICLPPYMGPKDVDDYSALAAIAKHWEPRVIVELGTAHGNTVANLCRLCPDATVHTVNSPIEVMSGTYTTWGLGAEEIGRVYRRHGYSERVKQIFCNTLQLDLRQYLTGPTVDLAIVDACHDLRYVLNDFEKVRPFVRQGGVTLFHDTHPSLRGHLADSYLACMRLRERGYDVRHVDGTWWGVWVNGE